MIKRLSSLGTFGSVAAIAYATAVGPASAQQQTRVLEQVTVVAPRLVRHTERTPTGAANELVSLTRRVSIGDLDLTKYADVMELEKRINETAEEACDYLAEMFPLASPDTPDCVRRAVDGAMAQAHEAIAQANE